MSVAFCLERASANFYLSSSSSYVAWMLDAIALSCLEHASPNTVQADEHLPALARPIISKEVSPRGQAFIDQFSLRRIPEYVQHIPLFLPASLNTN